MRDLAAGTTTLVSVGQKAFDYADFPSITPDGRFISFSSDAVLEADDTNNSDDVFVRDLHPGL